MEENGNRLNNQVIQTSERIKSLAKEIDDIETLCRKLESEIDTERDKGNILGTEMATLKQNQKKVCDLTKSLESKMEEKEKETKDEKKYLKRWMMGILAAVIISSITFIFIGIQETLFPSDDTAQQIITLLKELKEQGSD